ncbi:MAG: catechol 1,2-dioxygenase [Caulobacteraceae bacterium]|nr:catechol 1,2-dioxygenase [Caulobacteraceae bacterium]
MTTPLIETAPVQELLDKLSGKGAPAGDPRLKAIIRRIVGDLFATIDEFDITEDEFWAALNFAAAGAPEYGLWAAGLGLERYLDLRMDLADAAAGLDGGTPRTIEGPLYVAGAPASEGFARLDDGSDKGEALVMHGQVRDVNGQPIAGAKVEVWHANTLGNYSYFDKTQSDFNLRRTIITGADGRYAFRSIVPSGYSCPGGGSTDAILSAIGRHGNRPAHIHFFVSAPSHRHLTTQINIEGDAYLRDDFAYATKEDLIPALTRRQADGSNAAYGIEGEYAEIAFDFVLHPAPTPEAIEASSRARTLAGADAG